MISVNLIFTLVTHTSALDALKSANPDGRFLIKLRATDLRVVVMESGRHVWNGDVDLGDGELQKLRQNYDGRFKLLDGLKIQGVSVASMRQAIPKIIDDLDADIEFLDKGLKEASDHFHKKVSAGKLSRGDTERSKLGSH